MTADTHPGTAPVPTTAPPQRTGPVLALLVVSAFVVILNETIMSVALSRVMTDLDITATTAQWLTTGFMLTMAIVIPLTGYLLQRFPLRGVFFAAMTLFTTGTLIAALAPGFGILLTGRVVQASGTAIMLPLLFTTVLTVVAPERRGRMMGMISIVIAAAPAVGPTVSGLILSAQDWRWLFWLMLPLAVIALVLGTAWVRNVTELRDARFDLLSVILSALGFGGLIYGLSSIGESASGHTPFPVWISLVIGSVALASFAVRQVSLQKQDAALLDLRTFTSRTFSLTVVLMVVIMSALFGTLILLPLYLQQVLGLDTLTVGLMLLPGGVLMAAIAPAVGWLYDRFGPTPLVVPGMTVAAAALWGMTTLGAETSIAWIIVLYVGLSFGLGFVITPLLTVALGSLPRPLYSHGSAIISTIQQVAGAAGTALFITLMTVGTASAMGEDTGTLNAISSGVHIAFLAGAIIASCAVILTFFVRRPDMPDDDAAAPAAMH